MTQQPQVKHADRTRAQPGLRVCQTELTGKGNNLTTFYTGTPSDLCRCYPYPTCFSNKPNLRASAPTCKPCAMTTTTHLVKLPPSKHTILKTALDLERKVRKLPQSQISRIR